MTFDWDKSLAALLAELEDEQQTLKLLTAIRLAMTPETLLALLADEDVPLHALCPYWRRRYEL